MKLTRKQRLLLRRKRISRARHKRRKLQRLKDNIELYRNDPAKFAEDVLGIELKGWGKALLRLTASMHGSSAHLRLRRF